MKTQQMISIDNEMKEKLKDIPNFSGLINNLLQDYFNGGKNLKKEELKKKIKEKEAEIEEEQETLKNMKDKLEKLKEDEEKTNEVFKDIPHEIIEDIHHFKNMDENILKTRFNEIYSNKYNGLDFEKVKAAFNEIRGNGN